MEFKTEQNIFSYGIGMAGVVIIIVFSKPDGYLGYFAIIVGILALGFGGVLKGSIDG